MTTGNDFLHLLAYPLTKELQGTAHLYRLPESARSAWLDLLDRYREDAGSRANLPYSGLATALRAFSHTSVNLFPSSRNSSPQVLVSRHRLDPRDLHDATVLWEQALLHVPEDKIGFSYTSELADLLAEIEPAEILLADQLTPVGTQPHAPTWVYDAATWEVAQQLADATWNVDGHAIRFRADTEGNLIVWDPDLLWPGRWGAENDLSYATMRIQVKMRTLPWMPNPVVVLDPSVSRFSRWLNSSRTAWLAQRSPTDPLLTLALEGRGAATRIEYTSDLALSVWSRLGGDQLIRPEDRDLTGVPNRLRALVPKSVRFPVGRGLGMYTIRELGTHVGEVLGVPNITARNVAGHRFSKSARRTVTDGRDSDLLNEEDMPEIVRASGAERLRILVLYGHQHTRIRLQQLLAFHFNRPDLATSGTPDDQPVPVGGHVEIVFRHAPDLLAHGDHSRRTSLLAEIPHIEAPSGTRVLALCETEYDPKARAAQRKQSRQSDSTVPDPDEADAKFLLSRLLAQRNILAQFIATKPPAQTDSGTSGPERASVTAENDEVEPTDPLTQLGEILKKDHPGHNAVADLLRAAGLVHPRLGDALAYGRHGLTEPMAFVGLHVREQRGSRWKPGAARLSWSLVALIPNGNHWHTKAYQAKRHPQGGATGWQDYFTANSAFRSHPLPEGKRQDSTFIDGIDTALAQLTTHLGDAKGYVLLVSGDSTRALWPLLANKNFDLQPDPSGSVNGKSALPGLNPSLGAKPRAVVRITSDSNDLPRPTVVHRHKSVTGPSSGGSPQVIKTTEALYELQDARNTWILSNVPRQFKGGRKHSRAGENHSRWTGDNELGQHTWYAHTATEIVVLAADGDPVQYAIAVARLCDHAISWDGRTRYPAPVHLALKMDKDHPDYRRTVDPDDEIELDELGIES